MQLEEGDAPGIVFGGVFLSFLLIVGAVIWSGLTSLSEVARAPGEVVPAGFIHKVQHLEGGIVEAIHVKNGDRVESGDRLISMSPSISRSELLQLESRQRSLRIRLTRIRALLDGTELNLSAYEPEFSALVQAERGLFVEQLAGQRNQISVAETQIAQRQSELDSLLSQNEAIEEELSLIRELRGMRTQLAKDNVVAKADVINVSVRLAESMRTARELQGNVVVARRALSEARQKLLEVQTNQRQQLSQEAVEVGAELAEVDQTILRTRDRVDRLELTAPVTGIIKGMTINTINGVIEPGQVVMEVVPVGEELIVESRISPTDIGHVHVGQKVDVKVTSYESTRFGSVSGTLRQLSASTYLDDQRNPYYRAEISLARDYLGSDPNRNRIIPGMTVQSDIIVGNKTILDYILKPVYRGFQTAFRER
jgi:HlyD family type I secretion membrane fusion protein